jgi:hypothetical protein
MNYDDDDEDEDDDKFFSTDNYSLRLKSNMAPPEAASSAIVVHKENDLVKNTNYSFELAQSEVKPYSRIGSDEDENENDEDEQMSDDEHLETAISRQSEQQQMANNKANSHEQQENNKKYIEDLYDEDEGTVTCFCFCFFKHYQENIH